MADLNAGLLILDVSTPSNPRLRGNYPAGSGYAQGVAVSGSTVFVADDSAGLLILDVSTPSNPVFLGSYSAASSYAWDVAVSAARCLWRIWMPGC